MHRPCKNIYIKNCESFGEAGGTLLDSPALEGRTPSCSGSAGRRGTKSKGPGALAGISVSTVGHDNDSDSGEERGKGNTLESSIPPTSPVGISIVAELEGRSARTMEEVESSRPWLTPTYENGSSSSEKGTTRYRRSCQPGRLGSVKDPEERRALALAKPDIHQG